MLNLGFGNRYALVQKKNMSRQSNSPSHRNVQVVQVDSKEIPIASFAVGNVQIPPKSEFDGLKTRDAIRLMDLTNSQGR